MLKYYFASIIDAKWEGSGLETGSGSKPLTNGSGSGKPKNMRIRIPNTDIFLLIAVFSKNTVTVTIQYFFIT
jgi:hypothetical protein